MFTASDFVYLDIIQKVLLIHLDAVYLHPLICCEIRGNCNNFYNNELQKQLVEVLKLEILAHFTDTSRNYLTPTCIFNHN